MESYHHHHYNVFASQTQEPSLFATSHSLYPSSSSSGISNSRIGRVPSSIGDVPMTTAGPITISVVVALTLVICMILNCGKLRRKLSPNRSNKCAQPLLISTEKSMKQNKPIPGLSSSSGTVESPWSTTSTFFYPTFPPPVAQQPRVGPFYPPYYHHP